jgi:hypothetical protein
MVAPLGGADGDSGAHTTYVSDVDGGAPREALTETREHPPPMSKISMAGSPERRWRRPESAYHLCRRRRWLAPWEAVSVVWEHPPLTL